MLPNPALLSMVIYLVNITAAQQARGHATQDVAMVSATPLHAAADASLNGGPNQKQAPLLSVEASSSIAANDDARYSSSAASAAGLPGIQVRTDGLTNQQLWLFRLSVAGTAAHTLIAWLLRRRARGKTQSSTGILGQGEAVAQKQG